MVPSAASAASSTGKLSWSLVPPLVLAASLAVTPSPPRSMPRAPLAADVVSEDCHAGCGPVDLDGVPRAVGDDVALTRAHATNERGAARVGPHRLGVGHADRAGAVGPEPIALDHCPGGITVQCDSSIGVATEQVVADDRTGRRRETPRLLPTRCPVPSPRPARHRCSCPRPPRRRLACGCCSSPNPVMDRPRMTVPIAVSSTANPELARSTVRLDPSMCTTGVPGVPAG